MYLSYRVPYPHSSLSFCLSVSLSLFLSIYLLLNSSLFLSYRVFTPYVRDLVRFFMFTYSKRAVNVKRMSTIKPKLTRYLPYPATLLPSPLVIRENYYEATFQTDIFVSFFSTNSFFILLFAHSSSSSNMFSFLFSHFHIVRSTYLRVIAFFVFSVFSSPLSSPLPLPLPLPFKYAKLLSISDFLRNSSNARHEYELIIIESIFKSTIEKKFTKKKREIRRDLGITFPNYHLGIY